MLDYHIHSTFSPDANASMSSIIEKAIELNLKEICFTDHMDYDFEPSFDIEMKFEFEPKVYLPKIEELKKKYQHEIKILAGIELGLQPHMITKAQVVIQRNQFDFVLGSVHNVAKKDLTGENILVYSTNELWERYFKEMHYCIDKINGINSIGHFDVPKRYNEKFRSFNLVDHYEQIEVIYKLMIEKEISLEINTAGFKYGLGDNNPSIDFIKMYKDIGGEMLTLGSDSHNVNQLGKGLEEALLVLRNLGFTYVNVYEKQVANQIKISNLI